MLVAKMCRPWGETVFIESVAPRLGLDSRRQRRLRVSPLRLRLRCPHRSAKDFGELAALNYWFAGSSDGVAHRRRRPGHADVAGRGD